MLVDAALVKPVPTDEQLFTAFMEGNKHLVSPYSAAPSELRNGLWTVWMGGWNAAKARTGVEKTDLIKQLHWAVSQQDYTFAECELAEKIMGLISEAAILLESQAAEIARLKEDAERLNWVVETGYRVVLIEEPAIGWCVIIPPITYLTKGHTTMRAAIDSAKGKQ